MPKTITMLRDFPVSPNGFDNETWTKGSVHHDVADQLANDLILSAKAAIEVKVQAPLETGSTVSMAAPTDPAAETAASAVAQPDTKSARKK